jgi:hypothetical protein
MQPDHYIFASYESTGNALGLANAWETTVRLRRHGFKTRLATQQITRTTIVQTVIATPPVRPTRAERGCNL